MPIIELTYSRIYALRALLASLSPLIGAELELGHAVHVGWADEVSKDRLDDWREDGMELKQEVEDTLMDTFNATYWPLMRRASVGDFIPFLLTIACYSVWHYGEKSTQILTA